MTQTVGVVIPAAGRGTRFGSSNNKIWAPVLGRPLILWTLDCFQNHRRVDEIVVVGAEAEIQHISVAAAGHSKVKSVVAGGASRQASVLNGLRSLSQHCDLALVHDAARPMVSHSVIDRVLEGIETWGAAVPAVRISDTIKRTDESGIVLETLNRNSLRAVQTPQGASRQQMLDAYQTMGNDIDNLTDDSSILESVGIMVGIVDGDVDNLKVTCQQDILAVERLVEGTLTKRGIRTGFGYDVHRLGPNRDLVLGGVRIPHTTGLVGHSDADVILHSLCDALLGAAGMGDIGVLFPDTDMRHKDRDSCEFLAEVTRLLHVAGFRIVNVDIALVAEAPRIKPYREQMVQNIADGLCVSTDCVNIKATTSERMGFVGRHEGMACWAVATIEGMGVRE